MAVPCFTRRSFAPFIATLYCWCCRVAVASLGVDPAYPNCSTADLPRQSQYDVVVTQRDAASADGAALISFTNKTSDFTFNFAATWFPLPQSLSPSLSSSAFTDGLVVRVVECNPDHHSCANATHPQWSNAGAFAMIGANLSTPNTMTAEHVSVGTIRWPGVDAPPPSNHRCVVCIHSCFVFVVIRTPNTLAHAKDDTRLQRIRWSDSGSAN